MATPKPYILIILFSLLFQLNSSCFAQTSIDDLEKELQTTSGSKYYTVLIHLCSVYRNKGLLEKGLSCAQKGLESAKQDKNLTVQGELSVNIGFFYKSMLNNDMALKSFLIAYNLYEKVGNKKGVGNVLFSIGDIYRGMRNNKLSLKYNEDALKIRTELGDKASIAETHTGLGANYYDMNNFEKALEHFKLALDYFKSVDDKKNIALLENNIGSINNELKKYPDAIENYKSAMVVYTELKDSSNVSMCLANIGNVMNESGQPQQGIEYIQKSIVNSKKLNDRNVVASEYGFLIEGLIQSGDYKKAAQYQSELLNLKDTIYDLQSNQNIAEMQTRFDTDKKEKENQILKQQNDLQNLSINRQKIINYSVTLGLVLVMVLAFFIFKGYRQKQKANLQLEEKNVLIEEKNKIVEEKNKDITDSIRYAKRLQTAILKPENTLTNYFDDGFILFKPKDIVSGDFYWFEKFGNLFMVAAADCTGHGVPGAFMSIIGCNLLSQAVNEYAITQPAAILNSINKGLTKVLQQKGDADSFVTDGMDIALCSFNPDKMIVEYSGAFNPMWLIRNNTVIEYTADKFPVGAFVDNQVRMFNCHEIPVQKGDIIYVFSDGYADQFGGPLGKKFKYKQLQSILLENHVKPCSEQKVALNKAFENWIGKLEQIDDVLVIGIKI